MTRKVVGSWPVPRTRDFAGWLKRQVGSRAGRPLLGRNARADEQEATSSLPLLPRWRRRREYADCHLGTCSQRAMIFARCSTEVLSGADSWMVAVIGQSVRKC